MGEKWDEAIKQITEMSSDIKYIKEKFEEKFEDMTCKNENLEKEQKLLCTRVQDLESTNKILKWVGGIVAGIIIMIFGSFFKK